MVPGLVLGGLALASVSAAHPAVRIGTSPTTTIAALSTTHTVIVAPVEANGSSGGALYAAPYVPNSGALGGLPISSSNTNAESSNWTRPSKGTTENFGGDGFGVSYAPYKADNACKTSEQVADDFSRIQEQYSLVRIYGTDCDQVSSAYAAAKGVGVKLFLGVWDINQVADETSKIIEGIHGDWDIVKAVSVSNELVNNGEATAQEVISAMAQARSTLREAGYEGPVVTVDTFNAAEANPELCEESDFCAINAHAFFDSSTTAGDAGDWLLNTVGQVKAALPQPMQAVVTETGWPTSGETNGNAEPGLQNQKKAIEAIKQAFSSDPADVILFSAFNDLWKHSNENQFAAERYWGIDGAVSNSDR